ncbi:hypothetical protein JCM10449v2_008013 [Rhodotorula kratochvilovae]
MPYTLRSRQVGTDSPESAHAAPPAPGAEYASADGGAREEVGTDKGGEDRLAGLPAELKLMIVRELASVDLLDLSQTSKLYYHWLRDEKSMSWLWAEAREHEWPWWCCCPRTLRVSEVQMAHLLQGSNCSRCGSSDKHTVVNYVHLLRLCPDCKITLRQAWRIHADLHPLTALCCRHYYGLGYLSETRHYWLPELVAVSAKLHFLEDASPVPHPHQPDSLIPALDGWLWREEREIKHEWSGFPRSSLAPMVRTLGGTVQTV